ncbi:MAG: hypothetical protein JO254_10170 [Pseudolabrys sp.]|nr:hypothetical protein [Pseudolabrys sp.]
MVSAVKQRGIAVVALFALALQLCLSFAHIHHEDFRGIASHGVQTVSIPAQDDTGDASDHDHCAVCVAAQITATAFWGAISVPTPGSITRYIAPLVCDRDLGSRLTTAFQARGPPLAV